MLPMVRGYMLANTVLVLIPSTLWIASIHVDYPNRLGLIWVAILFGKTSRVMYSSKPNILTTLIRSLWHDISHSIFQKLKEISRKACYYIRPLVRILPRQARHAMLLLHEADLI